MLSGDTQGKGNVTYNQVIWPSVQWQHADTWDHFYLKDLLHWPTFLKATLYHKTVVQQVMEWVVRVLWQRYKP